jgi:hypothetical protein
MKRSAALAPLSRDHHHALHAALLLRRATGEDVEAHVAHFLAFWHHDGRRHFEIEERRLLPALPGDDPRSGPLAQRVLDEHAQIRALARGLEERPGEPGVDAARALGELLHAHVRFEERELFPLLELRLTDAELARLGRAISEAEQGR